MRIQQKPGPQFHIKELTPDVAKKLLLDYEKYEEECMIYFENRQSPDDTLPQMHALYQQHKENFEDVEDTHERAFLSELYGKMKVTFEHHGIAEGVMEVLEYGAKAGSYIAYFCSDDPKDAYLNIAMTFSIEYDTLKIGYLARMMQGLFYYLNNPCRGPKCESFEFPRPDMLVRKVIGFARGRGARRIEMQPVGPGSLAMWHRLAVDPDMDPFYDTTLQKTKEEQDAETIENAKADHRSQFDIDYFKMAHRICASCDWFAGYTCDAPSLKDKVFFCGERCMVEYCCPRAPPPRRGGGDVLAKERK